MHKTIILKNIFTDELISKLSEIVARDVAAMCQEDIIAVTQGDYYPLGEEAHKILIDTLPLLPGEKISAKLLKHVKSTGVHTDTNVTENDGQDLNAFARTFIIPLKTQDTYTITFNEFLNPGTPGKEVNSYINSLPVTNQISSDNIEKYFTSFKNNNWIDKLSIEKIFPWLAGDALIFDRNRLHTGDDHLSNSIVKEGIVIWTTI